MDRLRQLWADAQTWWSGLSRREKVLVGAASGGGGGLRLLRRPVRAAGSADDTRRRTATKLTQLAEAQALSQSYAEAERARKADEAQLSEERRQPHHLPRGEGRAGRARHPGAHAQGGRPVGDGRIIESTVELTLTDVTLPKLVTFLSAVERGPGMVRVKSLRIEPRPKDNVITAWATVATYKLKEAP